MIKKRKIGKDRINRKIETLVKKGNRLAFFSRKTNAEKFAKAWRKKGYIVNITKSSAPVVESGKWVNAYAVVASKKKK